MSWLRRGHQERGRQEHGAPPAPPAPDIDSPDALRASLADVVRMINRSAGELPGAAVVAARELTDTLLEVIDTSTIRPLDVYAVIFVKSTLADYLPTSVQRYIAIAEELRDTPRADGGSPTASLLEQLTALQGSAAQVLVAARDQDLDALMSQGRFLRTKFARSDLDL